MTDLSESLMNAGVVTYIEEKILRGIEINTDDKHVNIYLRCFKQLEKPLEYVALLGIVFDESSVNASLNDM